MIDFCIVSSFDGFEQSHYNYLCIGIVKVRLAKAMVFPVSMYGSESGTVKKAESRRIDALNCGVGEDS